ncbi:hypothetical protein NM688_g8885 [Phlebia brevispora]|uniref:Uncharacterized protein n=1 Tax=Phlebia brevispora TaxID=194682 RepID=A0ACC1RN97_9APHY|nr:hypothetical protein NM688_g8885 [Phlebia brevispora]
MSNIWNILDLVLAAVAAYLLTQVVRNNRQRLPLPPGPKGLPFIGNVLDMPKEKESEKFTEWRHLYGDIVSLRLFGQTMIILNSPKVAVEMLERKSSIYSDRPRMEFGGEMVGWNQTLVLTPYGERFRSYRRFVHQLIGGKQQIKRFHSLMESESRKFLKRLLHTPEQVQAHIRHTAGSLIIKMAYGYEVQEGKDAIVDLVELAVDQFSALSRPGAFLVDIMPFLRYVPPWFPGAGFKTAAESFKKTLNDMVDVPFNFVKARMASGCFSEEHGFRGADTTVSANYSFFLAMTLYPEAQRKAQEEIDRVVGTDRLPVFADRENLPYVEALVQEVFRWNPVVPIGVPHRVLEDDIHAGYFIPKGSIIVPNIAGFFHDPEVYEDPHNFIPERFVSADGKNMPPDPRDYCFGFGRRICPGLHFADASVWNTCVTTLAAFNITKAVENGKLIDPLVEYTVGTISHPKPFRCAIKPRSAKAEALI